MTDKIKVNLTLDTGGVGKCLHFCDNCITVHLTHIVYALIY